MRRFLALAAILATTSLAAAAANRLPGPRDPEIAATCSPSGLCTACKNCKACKNCAQLKGKCSVCR